MHPQRQALHVFKSSIRRCNHSGVLRTCRYSWRASVGEKLCLLQKLLHLTSVCFCGKKYSRGVWNHRIQGQEDLMWEWVKKWSDNSEPFVILQVSFVNMLHFWSCFCRCTVVIYNIVLALLLFYVSQLAYILRMDVPDQNCGRFQTVFSTVQAPFTPAVPHLSAWGRHRFSGKYYGFTVIRTNLRSATFYLILSHFHMFS